MKSLLRVAFALSVLAGCRAPEPFDAGVDCPKLAYCGQCASHGACAWCGDPKESAKGQCVAMGRAECAAPSEWLKTPDRCPLPPGNEAQAKDSASSSQSPSTVAKDVGPERYNAIRAALARAFPQARITDDVVDGVATVLLVTHGKTPARGPKDERGREVAPITKHVTEKEHRLYLGDATHHRMRSKPPESKPMESKFTLSVPMVRVSLPEKLEADKTVIATEVGDVDLSRDHLLGSVDLIDGKYGGKDYLGRRPARVDLLTPARLAGGRFGAIALYLGYKEKADRGPSFYIFEAGTATGDAKMVYFSPDMKPIKGVTSGYLPTPFVSMQNTYSGGITMRPAPDEDEPETMYIQSYAPGDKDPYITVTLVYKRSPTMELALPLELTVDAAARVAMIANAMGLKDAEELQPVLADLGSTLHWEEIPAYVGSPAPTGSSAPTVSPPPLGSPVPAGAPTLKP